MKYEAHVTGREGRWWAVAIPALGEDARTQARRLEEVADEARDYIAVTLDVAPSEVEVETVVDDIGEAHDIAARSERILSTRKLIEALEGQVRDDTQSLAAELSREGVPMRDISTLVGTTFQRVGQLVDGVEMVIPPAAFGAVEEQRDAIREWAASNSIVAQVLAQVDSVSPVMDAVAEVVARSTNAPATREVRRQSRHQQVKP